MDQLAKIRDSILVYLSPAKRRRHTLNPSTPSGRATPLISSFNHATSDPRNKKTKAVIHGRINKKYLSPSDTKLLRQPRHVRIAGIDERAGEEKSDATDAESSSEISPNDSSSQQHVQDDAKNEEPVDKGRNKQKGDRIDEEEERDYEELNLDKRAEAELSAQEKVRFFLERQSEIAQRKEELDRLKKEAWHNEEAALYHRLTMRGYEPLLPSNWAYDFRTTPSQIFTTDDSQTFINSASGNDFRGTLPIRSLSCKLSLPIS